MSWPKTPRGMYAEIRRRYFESTLPSAKEIIFLWVEDMAEATTIDTRSEMASVTQNQEGRWVMSLNKGLAGFPALLYFTIAHECVHIKRPEIDHGSKDWNREVRLLQGKGLMLRCF